MTKICEMKIIRGVPIIRAEGKNWLFDTGCPFSSGDFRCPPVPDSTREFLREMDLDGECTRAIEDLRIMGRDKMKNYAYIDYDSHLVAFSDETIELDGGVAVPSARLSGDGDCLLQIEVAGRRLTVVLDTGDPISYLKNVSLEGMRNSSPREDNDLSGRTWTTPIKRVRIKIAGFDDDDKFFVDVGTKNPNPIPYDGVLGYDFFSKYRVLWRLAPGIGPMMCVMCVKKYEEWLVKAEDFWCDDE